MSSHNRLVCSIFSDALEEKDVGKMTVTEYRAFTLYDIPSCLTPPAWNPSVWKARLILNYKRIPYKTEWVSHPDIEAIVKKLGCAPTTTILGRQFYTVPVIVDNSGDPPVAVCDSLEIAKYLDAKFPERPIFPKKGVALEHAFELCFKELVVKHLTPTMAFPTWLVIDNRGKVYYREIREQWFGKKLEEIEAQWDSIKQGFDKIAGILDQNGPEVDFVAGGSEPTRADFILVSYLIYIHALTPEEGWENRVKHWNGGRWQRLWNKSEEWRIVH